MFHLDNNSGVSSMPAISAMQNSATRWFTEGAGNQSPSWPGQDWFNIVQAELLNVLADAGITPEKAKFNQLSLAIKSIIDKKALLIDNFLSEISKAGASSQNEARKNLGLGGSAVLDIGTTTGTVAAGDDSRIVNAVQNSGGEITGDLTIQKLFVNDAGFIEKRGNFNNTDGSNSTNLARMIGRDSQFTDIYHYEMPGSKVCFSIHVSANGADGWFEFWHSNEIRFGNAIINGNGDLYGPMWSGWLSAWLNTALAARDNSINNVINYVNGSFIADIRLAGEARTGSSEYISVPGGCVMTGLDVAGDSGATTSIGYRAIQKYVNGQWYNIGWL